MLVAGKTARTFILKDWLGLLVWAAGFNPVGQPCTVRPRFDSEASLHISERKHRKTAKHQDKNAILIIS
jgi:hypothetical protein